MTFQDCSDRRTSGQPARWRQLALRFAALALAALFPVAALAFDPFVVKDIRVEGAQRTEAGTVFSYLPIKVGERIDDARASQAVKALYATGFFRDVRLERQGDVLVVVVQERPTISSITFVGNKEFDTDTVKKAMKDIGLSEARIFDRSALERAEQELKRQYISRGLYSAKVQTTVTPQERNRVAINFSIDEGAVTRIQRINIVGAKAFTEQQLLREITLTTPGWFTWYTKNDQYSKQKLGADLEALRSFYQDRGYLEFAVESTQVAITPDRQTITITVNVNEGPRYTISDVRLAGEIAVDEPELRRLIRVKPGDTFSRARLQASAKDMSDRLGAEGYAFANVNAVPEIDRDKATVAFTFFVDPGRRVYVRKVNISGNVKTRDEVIRREVRQLEGAWYDGPRIERSKVRIRRLGYFEPDINIETPPVPGSPDQVDLEISVTEKSTGNLLAGVGYSSSDGLVFSASVSQQNVLGSGNALSVSINTSSYNTIYSFLLTEPYWTVDGVSRTIEAYYRKTDPSGQAISQYESSVGGAAIGFGVPVTETDVINFGLRVERTSLSLLEESPPIYKAFILQYGNPTWNFVGTAGWARDTRDDILYPTRGRLQSAYAEVGMPPADLQYYRFSYLQQYFTPVWGDLVLMLRGEFGYADGYGDPSCPDTIPEELRQYCQSLPFFKVFYGGGIGSVRGYENNSLGPRDQFGNVLGGRRKIVGNVEAFYPIIKGDKSVRGSVFFDVGQIWARSDLPDYLAEVQSCAATSRDPNVVYPNSQSFRYSAGIGLAWNSPVGPLKFSYAFPLNKQCYDKTQQFQFQVGNIF
jgi:outer membrane protein insertion porin family